MTRSEKLKVLIDSIKTANDLMRKQIEINGRAVELLGEFITEPEQVETKTEFIKPEEMKAENWYVQDDEWLFKFRDIEDNLIMASKAADTILNNVFNENGTIAHISDNYKYRHATQAEILRYFPDEIECPTHGGNDAAYIKEFTDPQI